MSHHLLALDPSVKGTGLAVFTDGILEQTAVWQCDLAVQPEMYGEIAKAFAEQAKLSRKWDALLCEVPEIYYQSPNPQHLVAVAVVAGAMCAMPAKIVRTYTPKMWKGQVTKAVHHKRLLQQVSEEEKAVLDMARKDIGKTLFHNAMDAVGLGLWYLQMNMGRKKHP